MTLGRGSMRAMKGPLVPAAVVGVIAIAAAGYGWYATGEALVAARSELSTATSTLAEQGAALEAAKAEYDVLEDAYQAEKGRNDVFAEQIEDLSGTVGKLDKLSRIDPELLQKYSKVYFLSEHYVPSQLAQIPQEIVGDEDDEFFHASALPFLEALMRDAEEDGIDLRIASAYRSFDTQKALKSGYAVRYGSGANAFSADQGYSEHQLGTTLDFRTSENGGALATSFETTEAFAWLESNAHKHGFVLSYPKGNAYYMYEPWHWRFVGEKLARDLHEDGKHFYDLDQRELDAYLISLFD